MKRSLALPVIALHLLTAGAAIGWMYASHKYDCFNIGPCVGDVDYWINFGDFASIALLAWWVALLALTAMYSKRSTRSTGIYAWSTAILLPPAVLCLASWLFNLGVHAIPA